MKRGIEKKFISFIAIGIIVLIIAGVIYGMNRKNRLERIESLKTQEWTSKEKPITKEELDVEELKEFLKEADTYIRDNLDHEKLYGDLSSKNVAAVIEGGNRDYVYSFEEESDSIKELQKGFQGLKKYYESDYDIERILWDYRLIYRETPSGIIAGRGSFVYGVRDYIEDESKIWIGDIEKEKDGHGEIITCIAEKIAKMDSGDNIHEAYAMEYSQEDETFTCKKIKLKNRYERVFRNYYTYKVRRENNGKMTIVEDRSKGEPGRIIPRSMSREFKLENGEEVSLECDAGINRLLISYGDEYYYDGGMGLKREELKSPFFLKFVFENGEERIKRVSKYTEFIFLEDIEDQEKVKVKFIGFEDGAEEIEDRKIRIDVFSNVRYIN